MIDFRIIETGGNFPRSIAKVEGAGVETGRWFSPDPLADNHVEASMYAFCGGNPVTYVDPDGRDWYSYIDESKSEINQEVRYTYTNYTSQEALDKAGIAGTYLGEGSWRDVEKQIGRSSNIFIRVNR